MAKQQEFSPDLFNNLFDGQHVGFQLINGDVMVNATEMAKVFGKQVSHFLHNDGTKKFIQCCLSSRDSVNSRFEKEENLYTVNHRHGTWMHRILALKFAAWLNPEFELWVFTTIDEILFGHFRRIEESLKDSAKRQNRLDDLTAELSHDERFLEYLQLQTEERRAAYARGRAAGKQKNVFRGSFRDN